MKTQTEKQKILNVRMPSDDWQKYLKDCKIEYHRDMYGFANSYDNVLMIAGYGAFFALWTSIAHDITQISRAITVIAMGVSLLFYVAWHLIQMISRQRWEFERSEAFQHELDPETFNRIWNDALEKYLKRQNREIRLFWPAIFATSVALGLGSGIFLVSQAIAIATGLPQFTGKL